MLTYYAHQYHEKASTSLKTRQSEQKETMALEQHISTTHSSHLRQLLRDTCVLCNPF